MILFPVSNEQKCFHHIFSALSSDYLHHIRNVHADFIICSLTKDITSIGSERVLV